MSNSFSSSQKDEPIPLKVIHTFSIPSRLEEQFFITKFTPFSMHKIARDYNTQEKMKTSNDPFCEKGDVVDANVDPKSIHPLKKKR